MQVTWAALRSSGARQSAAAWQERQRPEMQRYAPQMRKCACVMGSKLAGGIVQGCPKPSPTSTGLQTPSRSQKPPGQAASSRQPGTSEEFAAAPAADICEPPFELQQPQVSMSKSPTVCLARVPLRHDMPGTYHCGNASNNACLMHSFRALPLICAPATHSSYPR